MAGDELPFSQMEATLKRTTAALRDAGIPFLLGGSLASWARGGPETRHDLDFVVKPEDAERALEALEQAGMRVERPHEQWLYKAWDDDVLVDLIFEPRGLRVTDEVIDRGDEMEVLAIGVRVMALEDVLTTKLLSIDEHSLDYGTVLEMARALREQIDWEALRERTDGSPFAAAFFTLVEELGSAPRADGEAAAEPPAGQLGARVRVVPPNEEAGAR